MADSIEIVMDTAKVRALFGRLPGATERALRGALTDGGALVLRDLSTYPPAPAGSTYIRTHVLQASWSQSEIRGSGLDLSTSIGSSDAIAPYNRWVQDAERQTELHRATGWPTAQGVATARERAIFGFLEARLRSELP